MIGVFVGTWFVSWLAIAALNAFTKSGMSFGDTVVAAFALTVMAALVVGMDGFTGC